MKFAIALVAAVAQGAFAFSGSAETDDHVGLEARSPTMVCPAKISGGAVIPIDTDEGVAKEQAKRAGLTEGRSGYPRTFSNDERLKFDVANCDKKNARLLHYPIYWDYQPGEWQKDVYPGDQEHGATPLAVVFVDNGGVSEYCGIVTHEFVDYRSEGHGKFVSCHKK
ncbi:hirsutellin A toxin [Metarhizium rileyi]|uniref:Hirsutellin A toxin n=1 Tax=Metarhizium rileyi (strain RCEF 4871) TaxID=1649241 RepID=A0A166WTA3_METRR|nr:hirsutellin A toxin [Metarhizium rileyi RCEF 4871]TWU71704.1 hypothetical protein ED733_003142 [Metarhizium rileyi]